MLFFKESYDKYSVPNIFKWLVQCLMQNADKLIAALFIGVHVLGIVSLFAPLMMAFVAITMLFVMGLNVKLNYYLGAGEKEAAEKLFTTISILVLLTIGGFSILCYFNTDAIFNILKMPTDYISHAKVYFPMFLGSFVFLAGQMTLDAGIIADRNPKFSAVVAIAPAVLNVVLNILFVAKLDMGIKGLALATLISAIIGFILAIGYFLGNFNKNFKPKLPSLDIKPILEIMYNGSSELFTAGSEGVIMFTCNFAILTFMTQEHLEAFSIVALITPIVFNVSVGGVFGAQPIISELLGEGDVKTGFKLMNYTMKRTFKYGIICLFSCVPIVLLFGKLLGQQNYLLQMYFPVGIGYALSVFNFGSVVYITSIQKPLESIVSAVLRGSIIIPLSIILSVYFMRDFGSGISIGLGFVLAEILLLIPLFKYRETISNSVIKDLMAI